MNSKERSTEPCPDSERQSIRQSEPPLTHSFSVEVIYFELEFWGSPGRPLFDERPDGLELFNVERRLRLSLDAPL
jgi:hypothetical protein